MAYKSANVIHSLGISAQSGITRVFMNCEKSLKVIRVIIRLLYARRCCCCCCFFFANVFCLAAYSKLIHNIYPHPGLLLPSHLNELHLSHTIFILISFMSEWCAHITQHTKPNTLRNRTWPNASHITIRISHRICMPYAFHSNGPIYRYEFLRILCCSRGSYSFEMAKRWWCWWRWRRFNDDFFEQMPWHTSPYRPYSNRKQMRKKCNIDKRAPAEDWGE